MALAIFFLIVNFFNNNYTMKFFFLNGQAMMGGCSSVESPPFGVSGRQTSGRTTKTNVETTIILSTVENGGSNERSAVEDV